MLWHRHRANRSRPSFFQASRNTRLIVGALYSPLFFGWKFVIYELLFFFFSSLGRFLLDVETERSTDGGWEETRVGRDARHEPLCGDVLYFLHSFQLRDTRHRGPTLGARLNFPAGDNLIRLADNHFWGREIYLFREEEEVVRFIATLWCLINDKFEKPDFSNFFTKILVARRLSRRKRKKEKGKRSTKINEDAL